ncbi:MAG: EAL domain-containing protein [Nitriliruptor sp.]
MQLTDPRLIGDVAHALRTSGLPPEALILELTENALEGDVGDAAYALWQLRDLGVQLAIDDFGTGYSSLNRLRELPFDVLKIDRSFVAGLSDERHRSLLCAILGLANSLGLETVAEGIETEAQRDFLRTQSCHLGQGYLLGRPAPATHRTTGRE